MRKAMDSLREYLKCNHEYNSLPRIIKYLAKGRVKVTRTCSRCGAKYHTFYRPEEVPDERISEAQV